MREADLGQRSQTRQCLTCKNKGCIGHCRFAKPIPKRASMPLRGVLDEATTLPRLYRSPIESYHWLVWTDDRWFRFPAKLDGWAERRAATNVSRQKLQPVPIYAAKRSSCGPGAVSLPTEQFYTKLFFSNTVVLASGAESQMLRVTVEDVGTALRLRVGGRLAGAWVPELEQSWRTMIRRSPGVSLIADLTDTEFVDLAGTYLLSLMYRSGVHLRAKSLYMKNVIADITAQAGAERI